MKKLLVMFSLMMIMAAGLLVPNQDVSAEVIVHEVEISGSIMGFEPCERSWEEGGITHLRNCVVYMAYTSDDPRLIGTSTMTFSRNVFSDEGYPARGHGSWVLDPDEIDDGYWEGTFTANIDETGYMTVNIIGRGYGSLAGLLYETTAHEIGGQDTAYITELPSYDEP